MSSFEVYSTKYMFLYGSVVDNDLYLLGGVESDGAAECAQGLYILNTGIV